MDINYFDKLRSRKIEVKRTLRHLKNERRAVESNTDWVDRAAYESRIYMLDRLAAWYQNERHRIDDALNYGDPKRYGLCLSCHEPIEAEGLQLSPVTQFCIDCAPKRITIGLGVSFRASD
jgi:RNA polymerase-binding transcription factor DksA